MKENSSLNWIDIEALTPATGAGTKRRTGFILAILFGFVGSWYIGTCRIITSRFLCTCCFIALSAISARKDRKDKDMNAEYEPEIFH